mmetsp:Transcript_18137/g.23867  ORF Transcript_18137/g.23867 Transcript_18137/m.23867 type:complete len:92 (-) Transcript_18137:287-562(-)
MLPLNATGKTQSVPTVLGVTPSMSDICAIQIAIAGIQFSVLSVYAHKAIDVSDLLAKIPPNLFSSSIIGCDTNARSPLWGANESCPCGRAF